MNGLLSTGMVVPSTGSHRHPHSFAFYPREGSNHLGSLVLLLIPSRAQQRNESGRNAVEKFT